MQPKELTKEDFDQIEERYLMEISKSEEFDKMPAYVTVQIASWCREAAEKGYQKGISLRKF